MIELIVFFIFLGLIAFFSASEIAIVSQGKIIKFYKHKDKKLKMLEELLEKPEIVLGTILVGVNFSTILTSSIATPWFVKLFGKEGILVSTFAVTFFIVVFGEIIPKNIARRHSLDIALKSLSILHLLSKFLYPIVFIFTQITKPILWFIGKKGEKKPFITKEGLKHMIEMMYKDDNIMETEKKMVLNVFDFREVQVKDIMTPRIEITAIPCRTTLEEALKVISEEGHSRIPIYEGTLDNITGIIHVKDIFRNWERREKLTVKDIAHEPFFIPEFKHIEELLQEFRAKKVHLGIVIDEYGVVSGVVTIEDIVEEIFGEIRDEFEEGEEDYKKLPDGTIWLKGTMTIEDINEIFGLDLPVNGFETISGLIMDFLGKIPKEGESLKYKNLIIIASKVEENRISEVLIKRIKEANK